MAEAGLPKAVRDLVITRLHGMEEVEVLLLLAGEPSGLKVEEIRERLRLPVSGLPLASLTRLAADGLLAADASDDTRYCYAVKDAATRHAVELLGIAYNEKPVTLVRLVYSRPSVAQSFADAFRIKKDDHP
ncbi:MAG: hypothetical protein ABIR92_00370 [Gemmatimonadaceae bacterium]